MNSTGYMGAEALVSLTPKFPHRAQRKQVLLASVLSLSTWALEQTHVEQAGQAPPPIATCQSNQSTVEWGCELSTNTEFGGGLSPDIISTVAD
jgi:hypothetical protein